MRYAAVVGAGLAGIAACTPATVRPPFAPLPRAPNVILVTDPPVVTREVDAWLRGAGVPLVRSSEIDRYVETDWYVPRTDSAGPPFAGRVKTRVWLDPAGPGRTLVTIETVHRVLADPSRSQRDLEVLVPASGGRTADALLAALKERFTVP